MKVLVQGSLARDPTSKSASYKMIRREVGQSAQKRLVQIGLLAFDWLEYFQTKYEFSAEQWLCLLIYYKY